MGRGSRRRGFTLLEVLLASLIAVFLLAGLYFAMDMTLRQTQTSRDSLDDDRLATGVFNRMSLDLSVSLAPLPPQSGGNASSTSGTSSSTTSSSGTTGTTGSTTGTTGTTGSTGTTSTGTSGTTTGGTSSTGTSTDTTSADTGEALAAAVAFQGGVVGTDKQLVVYTSRVPAAVTDPNAWSQQSDPNTQAPSDLRKVTYWLATTGEGLCRQERPWVTADGVQDTTDPDLTDEPRDVIADLVKDLQFEYFDGSSWLASWDGTAVGPDGVTPSGPPRAVRVNLWIDTQTPHGEPVRKLFQQVIPIRAAPGTYTPSMTAAGTDPSTVSSGNSTASGGTTP